MVITKYRVVERTGSNKNKLICKGDLQYCLDTLIKHESFINSTDSYPRMYIIEVYKTVSTKREEN